MTTGKQRFGGNWTQQKLDTFIEYVKAYLTILNKFKKEYNWKTIYFDGFAGSGEIIKGTSLEKHLFQFGEVEDITVYKGSVRRILELPVPYVFDYYYFIDTNWKNIQKIIEIKNSEIKHIDPSQIIQKQSDCNNELQNLAQALCTNRYAALVFLDPFGMQIHWESIASLKGTRSDIWILIPSGVAVNRMLTKDHKKLVKKELLEKFFGLSEDKILSYFYVEDQQIQLFDSGTRIQKKANPIEKIVKLYQDQLKTVWSEVILDPLVMRNSRNVPIYHLLFGSNKKVAMKIAQDIIYRKQ